MYLFMNKGFYPIEFKENYISTGVSFDDAVEISADIYAEFSQSAPVGKMLGANDQGYPSWVDSPQPSHNELVSQANSKKSQLKSVADSEIEWRQDAIDDKNANEKEIADLTAWRKCRVALMRIDTSKAPDIEWPTAPA